MRAIVTILTLIGSSGPAEPAAAEPLAPDTLPPVCAATAGPEYYAIELYTTKNLPGTGYATGQAEVAVSGRSPFSVAVTADGSYRYDIDVSLERMKAPRAGTLVAWVTTPEIDRIQRLGALDENLRVRGGVEWNQFIVVVTLEPGDDPAATIWTGPIALRGMSRSGMLHTMVGHGALQEENCAAYGYGNGQTP